MDIAEIAKRKLVYLNYSENTINIYKTNTMKKTFKTILQLSPTIIIVVSFIVLGVSSLLRYHEKQTLTDTKHEQQRKAEYDAKTKKAFDYMNEQINKTKEVFDIEDAYKPENYEAYQAKFDKESKELDRRMDWYSNRIDSLNKQYEDVLYKNDLLDSIIGLSWLIPLLTIIISIVALVIINSWESMRY